MIGDAVNLAARLMQAAGLHLAGGEAQILCDEATYLSTKQHLHFETLPPMKVKGKVEALSVYRPIVKSSVTQPRLEKRDSTFEMVGRSEEKAVLVEEFQALLRGNLPNTVIIEGEAGIGKSRLIEEASRQADILHINRLIAVGDAIEKSTAYHGWRPVFKQLFESDSQSAEALRERLLDQLEAEPRMLQLAPLLKVVLPLDLADNELTSQMSGEVRADNTNALLTYLLQDAVAQSHIVLIVEDAHWLDSASWALLRRVSRDVQPLYLILASRPIPEPVPPEFSQLLKSEKTKHLHLQTLPPEQTIQLVCHQLGVNELPQPVTQLLLEKAEGHPFFSEELAYALRDSGLIEIRDGACKLTAQAGDLSKLDFPDSIDSVITSRIDLLSPQQQLTLKVASVIGRIFAFQTLKAIHPIENDIPHLPHYLNVLENLGLTRLEAPEPELSYIFKHIITQEVAYKLMAYAQRRRLHRATAEWLERVHVDDLLPYYPLLAHHWSQVAEARDTQPDQLIKAIDYLEKAGEQAMRSGAYREAVGFFSRTLELHTRVKTDSDQLRRAHWERQLGDAHYGLGQLTESRQHHLQALMLLGKPMPTTKLKLATGLVGQFIQQGIHRIWPTRFVGGRQTESETTLQEILLSYERLAQITYMEGETLSAFYVTLRMLNLAEIAGPSSELVRTYATVMIGIGLIPLRAVADVYARLAQNTAQNVQEQSTLAWVLQLTAMHNIGVCRWVEAFDKAKQATEINERLGRRRWWDESVATWGVATYLRSHYVQSNELWRQVYESAHRRGDPQVQVWALCNQVTNYLRLGDVDPIDEVIDLLEEAQELLGEYQSPNIPDQIRVYGGLAQAHLQRGEYDLAHQVADLTAQHISIVGQPSTFYVFDGYVGPPAVYLTLWETKQTPAGRDELAKSARQACKALARFAQVFLFAQPRAWLYNGWYAWLNNKHRKAHKAWRKSLAHAQRLEMPYEEGLAHYQIGRHLLADDPSREEHLQQAAAIFERLGTAYDLSGVREELNRVAID